MVGRSSAGEGEDLHGSRFVKLSCDVDGAVRVARSSGVSDGVHPEDPAQTIHLPRLSLSVAAWCEAVADRFWQQRRRCLMILLTLDLLRRQWGTLIPTQQCGRDRASIQIKASDLDELPEGVFIAGSFQICSAPSLLDAWHAVPFFDGIHLVTRRGSKRPGRQSYVFLRCGEGEMVLADPAVLMGDDVAAALRDAADRLQRSVKGISLP